SVQTACPALAAGIDCCVTGAKSAQISCGRRNKHERNTGGLAFAAPKCAAVLPVAWKSARPAHLSAITQSVSEEVGRRRRRRSRRCTSHRDLRAAKSHDERQGGTRGDSRDSEPGRFLR